MTIRRMSKLAVSNGAVVGYIHNAVNPGLGKIGVLIALESTADKAKLEDLGQTDRHARGRGIPAISEQGIG
jgi:elongation factor Ts